MDPNNDKKSILAVDDDKQNLEILSSILAQDYKVYTAINGQDALKIIEKYMPDVILLDILMPEMDGFEVLNKIKTNEKMCNIPIIFITGLGSPESEEKGLAMGAADYIVKPFNPTAVKLRVQNQMQILDQIANMRQQSTMDQLTRIPNRRSFDYRIYLEFDHARRNKTPISLLLLDIDNFKIYNDTYGHMQGDTVLQAVAKILEKSLRRSLDFAARWGGEEFVVILPDTNTEGAVIVAETIRKNIEKKDIPCNDGKNTKITVSVGVNTCIPSQESETNHLLIGADKALYKAKESGKNKVCAYTES